MTGTELSCRTRASVRPPRPAPMMAIVGEVIGSRVGYRIDVACLAFCEEMATWVNGDSGVRRGDLSTMMMWWRIPVLCMKFCRIPALFCILVSSFFFYFTVLLKNQVHLSTVTSNSCPQYRIP